MVVYSPAEKQQFQIDPELKTKQFAALLCETDLKSDDLGVQPQAMELLWHTAP